MCVDLTEATALSRIDSPVEQVGHSARVDVDGRMVQDMRDFRFPRVVDFVSTI